MLTQDQINEVIRLRAAGQDYQTISRQLGITEGQIGTVAKNLKLANAKRENWVPMPADRAVAGMDPLPAFHPIAMAVLGLEIKR